MRPMLPQSSEEKMSPTSRQLASPSRVRCRSYASRFPTIASGYQSVARSDA